jgi:RNA polymerase sigma-B factor
VEVEHLVHAGQLEDTQDGRLLGGDGKRAVAHAQALERSEEDGQRGRVHERGIGQIDHDARLSRLDGLGEAALELGGGVEVELPVSAHDLGVAVDGLVAEVDVRGGHRPGRWLYPWWSVGKLVSDQSTLEERELLRRYHDEGDLAARDLLVERMLPLVRRLARRYANRGESLDDLEQVGSLGLIKAIHRFDVSRELKLSTFAVPTILGEIKRHFRDRVWSLRVPRDLQELNARLSKEVERTTNRLGRSPTVEELAAASHTSVERVLDAMQGAQAFSAVSLDEPTGDGRQVTAELLGAEDEAFAQAERRELLRLGLDALPEREREILHLRFFAGLTQREIADHVGISQMHVSRLIRRSLETMRDTLEPTV